MCRKNKKKWLNNKILQIENNCKKTETKKFFNQIKNFQQPQVRLPIFHRDTDGNIITQQNEVLIRWKDYFRNILTILHYTYY
jgi:hypothetical protein